MKTIVLATLLFCLSPIFARDEIFWSTEVDASASPINGRALVISQVGYDGHFYADAAISNQTNQAIFICGVKDASGEFWPNVRIAVSQTRTKGWVFVQSSLPRGEASKLQVEPHSSSRRIRISLDEVAEMSQRFSFAKVMLARGEAADFPIRDLRRWKATKLKEE